MTRVDNKIIKENPGLTPHQLMTEKGLSAAGFEEIVSAMESQATKELAASRPVLKPSGIITPITTISALPSHMNGNDRVRIRPKGKGGLGTEMSRSNAEKMVRRQPNSYEIIP